MSKMRRAIASVGNLTVALLIVTTASSPVLTEAADSTGGHIISISGGDWWLHDGPLGAGVLNGFITNAVPANGWIRAQVPGNIQGDVEDAHLIGPIWYGATDPKLYEVAEKDWWYRKDFVVPGFEAGQRLTLVFDGVDERCEVWLNGEKLGGNAGMFRRFSFDITGVARAGQVNHLAIWIARMPEELVPYLINSDGPGEKDPFGPFGFMTGVNKTRQRLKDLKTPGNFSYDWAFNVWTLGIWKDVRLEITGPARIGWTRVETSLKDNFGKALVRPTLEVDSRSDGSAEVIFTVAGPGRTVSQTVQATLRTGVNLIKAEIPLSQPALWWPNGQGGQPLYTLRQS